MLGPKTTMPANGDGTAERAAARATISAVTARQKARVRSRMCCSCGRRVPIENELVYYNQTFFVIGHSPTRRPVRRRWWSPRRPRVIQRKRLGRLHAHDVLLHGRPAGG